MGMITGKKKTWEDMILVPNNDHKVMSLGKGLKCVCIENYNQYASYFRQTPISYKNTILHCYFA